MDIKPPHFTDVSIWKMLLEYAVWAFTAPILWCVREIQKLKEADLVASAANLEKFTTRDDFKDFQDRIEKKLDRILDKVDGKADK